MLKLSPRILKLFLNFYGPYLGAGVRVRYISPDWTEIRVSMKLHCYNRNAVGTYFGGSLYSMVDPHLMLMLMQLLGEDYIVWDKAAKVEFVSPSKGTVSSTISIQKDDLEEILHHTNSGDAYFPEFDIRVLNQNGDLVAKVRKILYVRKKK
ncbi:MAG: DUF4442 domain-containing protein [Cyanobacteria bacterium J06635_15]